MENSIPVISVTGGPGGGKSTFLESYAPEKLMDIGFRIFPVPEPPTLYIPTGIKDISKIRLNDMEKYIDIEWGFLHAHLAFRDAAVKMAELFHKRGEKCVVLCDRGGMDFKPYMPPGVFSALLAENRLMLADVRDFYTAVIHLVTAAEGASDFYTLENNIARQENPDDAVLMDRLTRKAWEGHAKLGIIRSAEDFSSKMKCAMAVLLKALGYPEPIETERKFLLKTRPDFRINELKHSTKINIEQMYLMAGNRESRIRKRSQGDSAIYYRTEKLPVAGSHVSRQELEKRISALEYIRLQKFRDFTANIIRKTRNCFIYNYQYFELDGIYKPRKEWLLEIELTEENDKVDLPPFLNIEREVTGEEKYSNYGVAKGL